MQECSYRTIAETLSKRQVIVALIKCEAIMAKLQEPGEKPDGPGEYLEVGPRGGKIANARQVTLGPGNGKLPPTSKTGNNWRKLPKKR